MSTFIEEQNTGPEPWGQDAAEWSWRHLEQFRRDGIGKQ
jgi:hypothetical protein